MADFCWSCTEEYLGASPEKNDLVGLCGPDETAEVLCEGCGPIFVDQAGKRVDTSNKPLKDFFFITGGHDD